MEKKRKPKKKISWKLEYQILKRKYDDLLLKTNEKPKDNLNPIKRQKEAEIVKTPISALTPQIKENPKLEQKQEIKQEQEKDLEIEEEPEEEIITEKEHSTTKEEQKEVKNCPYCNAEIKEFETPCHNCNKDIDWV